MKYFTIIALSLLLGISGLCVEKPKVPTLVTLLSVVGASMTSDSFEKILTDYKFSPNRKRKNSWGSGFGVSFEVVKGCIAVVIRPPSGGTNMPTYPGRLPGGLKKGDTIADILRKLGKPKRTALDPAQLYNMTFEGLTVNTIRGQLFEVWLTTTEKVTAPSIETPPVRRQPKSAGK